MGRVTRPLGSHVLNRILREEIQEVETVAISIAAAVAPSDGISERKNPEGSIASNASGQGIRGCEDLWRLKSCRKLAENGVSEKAAHQQLRSRAQ